MRNFRDAAGVEWTVYITTPSIASGRRVQHLAEAYRSGWLVFESATEKRRFAPVPAEWAHLSDQALAALCQAATPQPAHRRAVARERPIESAVAPPTTREPDAASARQPLRTELREVTTKLDATIERVCDERAADDGVKKLDTGELIRVEETLALAAEMAKEAVTLRRKLHAPQPGAPRDEEERSR